MHASEATSTHIRTWSGPISFWTTRTYFPIFGDSKRRHARAKRVAGATGRATRVVLGGPRKEAASKTTRIDACDAAHSRTFGGPKGDLAFILIVTFICLVHRVLKTARFCHTGTTPGTVLKENCALATVW